MSGAPVRVAVQEGAATVRIAGAEADGAPWLIAEVPAPGPGLAPLLAELVGPAPEELLLVHPGRWTAGRAARWVEECSALAARVRAVPTPLAAAGRGGVAVLDVGAAGAEATLLDPQGRVHTCRTAEIGGRLLDERLAARLGRDRDTARAAREALSLLPAVDGVDAADLHAALAGPLAAAVAALREVLAGAGRPPVLLIGGVARDPALARLVDEAGITGATVAARPDTAAVLGALALQPAVGGTGAASDRTRSATGHGRGMPDPGDPPDRVGVGLPHRVDVGPADRVGVGPPDRVGVERRTVHAVAPPVAGPVPAVTALDAPPEPVRWLPPLPPRRRRPWRAALLTAAVAGAVAVLLAVGRLVAPPTAEAEPAGVLVQYGYRLDLPAGWEHTGGSPERRRILITPAAAPDGSDLIAVERSPLGYDTAAEPERARAELRAAFEAAVAAGSDLTGYDPAADFAGRPATAYREQDGPTVVDWFVVLDGDAQLSVGCRHTTAGAAAVRAACAVVVASVRRA